MFLSGGLVGIFSGQRPSRELSVGKIVSQTFNLYSSRILQFYAVFFGAALAIYVIDVVLTQILPQPPPLNPGATPDEILAYLPTYLPMTLANASLRGLANWMVGLLAAAIAITYTSTLLEKGAASLEGSLSRVTSRLLPLLGGGFITGLLILLGLILFLVPGILLALMYSLVIPTIMIEKGGTLESLGRSRKLTAGRWGSIFATLLVMLLLLLIASGASSLATTPLGPYASLIAPLIAATLQPLLPIALTLLYYSMIARESPSTPPPPPPQPTQG